MVLAMWKQIVAGVVVAVTLTGVAAAGPFEDGNAAFAAGDYATALRLFTPLAERGEAASENMLGVLYEGGLGVPQDYAEAVKWFRFSSDQGDPAAQNNLGGMYEDGEGVPRNYGAAYFWYSLAAARERYDAWRGWYAYNRDRAAQHLTPAQIAEAQRLAREWKPKPER